MVVTFTMVLLPALFPLNSLAQQEAPAEQTFSSVEERRLQVKIIEEHNNLANEKKALLLKEKKLESLEADIDWKLEEIDNKLAEMEKQKAALEKLLAQRDEAQLSRLQNLGKVYENMNPIQAARSLNNLDLRMAADILASMRPRSAAKIINGLNPEKASEISKLLLAIPAE